MFFFFFYLFNNLYKSYFSINFNFIFYIKSYYLIYIFIIYFYIFIYRNLQSNEVSGPLPESWTQKQNFKCTVPSGICKPKSLTDVTSICNNNLPECKGKIYIIFNVYLKQ